MMPIYSDFKVEEKKLSLLHNEKVYDLRIKQPARLLWIIPWKVESRYVINFSEGSMRLVYGPWYVTSQKLDSVNAVDYFK